ncbi:MAG: beta-propeller domain-containing protein [Candidatus Aenigmarchaeota archaeon]|nr:beta-propeller domain-containing protein [Candidatus Aenigmarchaeota archaeon]
MKGFLGPVALLAVMILVGAGVIVALNPAIEIAGAEGVKKFSSCSELRDFLQANAGESGYFGYGMDTGVMRNVGAPQAMPTMAEAGDSAGKAAGSDEFSTTNIQVEGVDEADIVKNDGKYLYIVSKSRVYIVDAYPAEDSKIVSEIEFSGSPSEIFINGDKLVVFTSGYGRFYAEPAPMMDVVTKIAPEYDGWSGSTVYVYDVSDRSSPSLTRNITLEGNYYDSRMIGDYVYVISQKYVNTWSDPGIPRILSAGLERPLCGCADVYYFDVPDTSYQFTTITSLSVEDDSMEPVSKVFLLGYSQNLYVSQKNIYITYDKRMGQTEMIKRLFNEVLIPNLPPDLSVQVSAIWNSDKSDSDKMNDISMLMMDYVDKLGPEAGAAFMENIQNKYEEFSLKIAKEMERSAVHKISISDGMIEYAAGGSFPGRILNQFSMDEYEGYFRVATTTSQVSRSGGGSANHVYVLDGNLQIVGKVEDLAQGEQIYSARFMGDRGYMVTFQKIDPLFVLDLSDPYNPRVLGKLKIPGYSDYLHPYDENHIIGIGKETVEAEQGNFAWYQGVKMAIFDVSDVENPKELHKVVIGDRGTSSPALYDHKAFLFSREKNLLVIPISLYEISDEDKEKGRDNTYGRYTFQGAYVYDITLEDGFVPKGRITHQEDKPEDEEDEYYYSNWEKEIMRSMYIDNVLYTLSMSMLKMNNLSDLSEIKGIGF